MIEWQYDSSRQMLVLTVNLAVGNVWKVMDLVKMGWNIRGLDKLPRFERVKAVQS